jgi:HlyD family secretion protein
LRIPNAALRFRPTGAAAQELREGGKQITARGPVVWILESGQLKRVSVTLGASDGNYTEVVSGDLKEGEAVVAESLTKTSAPKGFGGPRMF